MVQNNPQQPLEPEETNLSELDPNERSRIEAGIARMNERIKQDDFSTDPQIGEKQDGTFAAVEDPWPALEPLPPLPPLSIDQEELDKELRERDSKRPESDS